MSFNRILCLTLFFFVTLSSVTGTNVKNGQAAGGTNEQDVELVSTVAPSKSSNLYNILSRDRTKTVEVEQPLLEPSHNSKKYAHDVMKNFRKNAQKEKDLHRSSVNLSTDSSKENTTLDTDALQLIKPTKTTKLSSDGEENFLGREKRCFTCGGGNMVMDDSRNGVMGLQVDNGIGQQAGSGMMGQQVGSGMMGQFQVGGGMVGQQSGSGMMGNSGNRVLVFHQVDSNADLGAMQQSGSGNRIVYQQAGSASSQQSQQQQQLQQLIQQAQQGFFLQNNQGLVRIDTGTYTVGGSMQTAIINGYTYTMSSYTKLVDGAPTVGVVTLAPVQTYYNGNMLGQDQNPYGVPNVGTYTLAGASSMYQSNGYPYTVSSFTKVVDGAATYGAMTLAGMQTYYNGQLLQAEQNAYGVPNQGTYTLGGLVATSMMNGSPVTLSTYTKIANGVATFGTVTVGSVQTYYQGKLLQEGQNAYGVPNKGIYTLPGPTTTYVDTNGYPVTVSSYTKIIDGRATFGAMTQGSQMTYYNGNAVRYGENPYGVPNVGVYTINGNANVAMVNGVQQTMSTYTRVVNGVATFGTVTTSPMQTVFVPNQNRQIYQVVPAQQQVLVPVQEVYVPAQQGVIVQNRVVSGSGSSGSCAVCMSG